MSAGARCCDVLIVGGGLVGSTLACALGDLPLSVVLVETHEPARLAQPSFDERVSALANGSQRILATLGLWRALQAHAAPIRHIHVGEAGRFGAARIDAAEEGVPALGYTLENRALGRALWDDLATKPRVTALAPARVLEVDAQAGGATATIEVRGAPLQVSAKLLVAADGASSWVRRTLGGAVRADDYAQAAVILNCRTQSPPGDRAFERFTPSGPIALLPLTGERAAVVWTLPTGAAERAIALDDPRFRDELQAAFGYRLGRIERVGERVKHALARVVAEPLPRERVALIGNAAVALHPVAGQGFNLALRDVAALAEVIADEVRERGTDADVGRAELLARYRDWRALDRRRVATFTHGLIRLFGEAAPLAGAARGLGLAAFDVLPGAKALLARQTMGRAGRLPRLARGVSL